MHRDVKPSNVLVPNGDVGGAVLVDFGIAHLPGVGPARLTRTGIVIGTPGCMAPEQARGERDVDARADVFSLGCLLHECLIGAPAFPGAHVMEILAKIVGQRVPVGDVIDRGVAMLEHGSTGVVRIGEATAGLLGAAFDVSGDARGLVLSVARDLQDTARTLFGRESPCVGRARELAVLTAIFEECADEPVARAIIVTGAPGVGKSRLASSCCVASGRERGRPRCGRREAIRLRLALRSGWSPSS